MPSKVTEEYVGGVRALLFPAEPVAERAEALAPISDALAEDLGGQLETGDSAERATAAMRLLAKALVDLEVSALLKRAAEDEEAPARAAMHADRSAAGSQIEPYLRVLEEDVTIAGISERVALAGDAREQLPTLARDTLHLIASRAASVARSAFTKLAALEFAQVLKGAGVVGHGLAQALGIDEKLGRLYRLCQDYALKAYNALVTLLGDTLARIAGEKVSAWIKEHTSENYFGGWLEQQYAVEATGAALSAEIAASQAGLPAFQTAAQRIQDLSARFRSQMDLAGKLLKAMDYLRLVPAATTPQGVALFAGAYILVCGYAVFAGGDFLDSPSLDLLHRVAGVPTVVRGALA